MIKQLHHSAYRCRDAEETRAFYEDFLGLPLAEALAIGTTKTGRRAQVLHTFFGLDDGSEHTLEEVGKSFNVTRERIRQIESKALRKLRHPDWAQKIRPFLDDGV